MSTLISTFQPASLSGVSVDIDGCDTGIGASLATTLAAFGAAVDLRGENGTSLGDLEASIRSQWGRARIARDRCEQAAMVRILRSPDDARGFLALTGNDTATLIMIAPQQFDPALLSDIAACRGAQRVHILMGSDACGLGSLAAMVAFLLSPAGQNIPSQCLQMQNRESDMQPIRHKPEYPPMPVCSPAIAVMA